MKKYFIIFLLGGLVLSSCKKNYLDLTENPNYPSTATAASLLAPAEVKTASIAVDPGLAQVNVWMGYWAYSPNYAVNQDSRDYRFTNTLGQGTFTNIYSNAFDYQTMINFAVAQNTPALEGIGRTMKSFLMQWAVDIWNNVPYSEAFQGTANKAPAYEDAKTVYEKIYDDLTLAITKFKTPNASFPNATQDIMFGGDKTKWIKFANTIKLRILLRQSGRADRASYISAKLAADFPSSGGTLSSYFLQANEGAIVNPGYVNQDLKQNPYYSNFGYNAAGTKTGNNDFYKVSSYSVSFYSLQNDLRLFYVAKPVSSGGTTFLGYHFLGNEMGSQGNGAATYSDNLDNSPIGGPSGGLFYRNPTDAQPVLADFESLFLQAEAVQRGWFPAGNAQTIFNAAVLQSFIFDFDKIDGAGSGAAYVAMLTPTADNSWTLATDKIKLIITQKWAAMQTLNFIEPWAEYRRTGFPPIPLSTSSSRGARIPLRLKYPQTEYDLNGANVNSQGAIDQFTSKIWWMP